MQNIKIKGGESKNLQNQQNFHLFTKRYKICKKIIKIFAFCNLLKINVFILFLKNISEHNQNS